MRAHHLRQQGHSLRQISEKLSVSLATVRADLKLAQTHWGPIAAASADDLLLESLHLLRIRLTGAIKQDPVASNVQRLTAVEYLRARDARETQLNALAREIRRTVQQVHQRAEQRPDQPDLFDEEPQELSETITESAQSEPPNSTISSPEQEIVQSQPAEEKSPHKPTAHPSNSPAQPETAPNPPKSRPPPPANPSMSALSSDPLSPRERVGVRAARHLRRSRRVTARATPSDAPLHPRCPALDAGPRPRSSPRRPTVTHAYTTSDAPFQFRCPALRRGAQTAILPRSPAFAHASHSPAPGSLRERHTGASASPAIPFNPITSTNPSRLPGSTPHGIPI